MSYWTPSIPGVQARARAWLIENDLLVPGEPMARTMRRLAEYRKRLATTPKPGPKQWARDLVRWHAEGRAVPTEHLALANAALGRHHEPVLVHPDPKPPRPDAKERAAGDVEVAF